MKWNASNSNGRATDAQAKSATDSTPRTEPPGAFRDHVAATWPAVRIDLTYRVETLGTGAGQWQHGHASFWRRKGNVKKPTIDRGDVPIALKLAEIAHRFGRHALRGLSPDVPGYTDYSPERPRVDLRVLRRTVPVTRTF